MGLFSSLFGKREQNKVKGTITMESPKEAPMLKPTLHLKGKPDANGLYPAELVMLYYAEKYKVTEALIS
ncbi:MAG: hypothetical protein IJI62_10475 [Lachnospiraceae bacterium]|nr:hypothetical protein [Lachnospiraceae bacterium]MBQ6364418.1 hypothetical protein [Lachnospiraceae bacterium]